MKSNTLFKGFGDITPSFKDEIKSDIYRICVLIWIFFGLAYIGGLGKQDSNYPSVRSNSRLKLQTWSYVIFQIIDFGLFIVDF